MKSFLLLLFVLFFPFILHAQDLKWTDLKSQNLPLERHENALVAVGEKIVLIGGRGEKPVDIYNVKEKSWSQGAQPPFEIHHMQAVSLDGLVYILGGFTGSWPYETPLTHVLIYDVTADKWAIGSEIPPGRRRGAAGAVAYEAKIYLVNGIINGHTSGWVNWLDEYDPYTGNWKTLTNSPVARDHFHAAVIDNKLYVAGGRRSGSADTGFGGTVKETNIYNFDTNSWETVADIPTPRAGTAAAVIHRNYLVIGGESEAQERSHDEVEAYDPVAKQWKTLTSLNIGRHGTQAISFQDQVILGAGSGNRGGGPELTSFEILSTSGEPEIALENLEISELKISTNSLEFDAENSVKKITVTNPGEKAIVISYLQLDNNKDYRLNPTVYHPVIGPGQQVTFDVEYTGNERNSSAKLYIKTLGDSKPLEILLSR